MKKIIFLSVFIASIVLAGCSKTLSNTSDEMTSPLPPIDTTQSKIIYQGRFENGPYGTTMGIVSILREGNKLSLRLDSFRVNSGPDLKVYISKQKQPLDFYRVGSLMAFQGDQVYEVNANPDFSDFSFVLIHCEKFNHLFGSAVLMKK